MGTGNMVKNQTQMLQISIDQIDELVEKVEEIIEVFEIPPEHIDVNNYSEDEIEEGTLEVSPKSIKIKFENVSDIPESFEIDTIFSPWYYTAEYGQEVHGMGDNVGVQLTFKLKKKEIQNQFSIAEYELDEIVETG
jgi:hypothetical protein